MKLFGFGKSSEKRTAKVLGPNLTELFGGEEGAEMIVDANESGLAAIDAAESRLTEFNQQSTEMLEKIEAAETAKTAALEAQAKAEAALKAEQEAHASEKAAHAATTEAFEKLKAEPGASHTTVQHDGDAYNGGAPESTIRQEEAKARAEGQKLAKHKKK